MLEYEPEDRDITSIGINPITEFASKIAECITEERPDIIIFDGEPLLQSVLGDVFPKSKMMDSRYNPELEKYFEYIIKALEKGDFISLISSFALVFTHSREMILDPSSILIRALPPELLGKITVAVSPTLYACLSVENDNIVKPFGSCLSERPLHVGQST